MQIGGMYTIDFAKVSKIPKFTVNVKKGDNKRTIKLILLKNNEVLNLNNYTVVVAAKKEDGKDVFNDVKIIDAINGICEVEVTEQMLTLNMDLPCEIVLYNANGVVASSSNFIISVLHSVKDAKNIVSSNEYKVLSKALAEVKNIDIRFSEKADKSYVWSMENMGQDIKEAMTGGSVAVVGKDSVLTENIVNETITFEKFATNGATPVTTYRKNKNLFNKNTVSFNKYVSAGNGSLVENPSFYASDYIEVDKDCQYTISHMEQCAFYDKDKIYVSGINTSGLTPNTPHSFTAPSNAKYIRVTINKNYIDVYQLEIGGEASEYEKYGAYLRKDDIDPSLYKDLYFPTKDRIAGGIYEPLKLPNLFDKKKATKGKYVSAGNGSLIENSSFYASDYIEVIGKETYWNSNIEQCAFYDINKIYISGITTSQSGGANIPYSLTAPSNAKYIRVTVNKNYIDSFAFAEGNEPTNKRYGYEIPMQDIENNKNIALSKESTQLFNKFTATKGKYVSAGNGSLAENPSFYASDYIEVDGGCQYTTTHIEQCAFYDENKIYISGQGTSGLTANTHFTLTTPDNAKYIRVSINKSFVDIYKLEKGKFKKNYESFSNLISNKLYTPVQKITSMLVNSPSNINVKLIGDSITHGMGGTGYEQDGETIVDNWKVNTKGHCWANLLKNYLESKFNCTVKNFGMSGINSEGVHARIDSLIENDDDIVIIMLGTNDRGNESYKLERFLNLIVNYIKKLGKEVILMSNIPSSIENEQTSYFVMHMEDVDHTIMRVANNWKMEYISVYKLFIDYCCSRNITIDELLSDGLHPNDAGYDVMFYLICNKLGFGTKRPGATW